jgi:hypothetical protein
MTALLKITTLASFPRKRESTGLGPRFRGGDEGGDFDSLGWAAGPWKLRRRSRHSREKPALSLPRRAGIQFLPEMDPRFRGGDVLNFISIGGPLAHKRSE